MTLAELLLFKYPDIRFPQECVLQDDGEGQYIAQWNREEPQPVDEDILTWTVQFDTAYGFAQNKIANKPIYDQLEIIDLKSIRAMRTNDTGRLATLEAEAVALRAQLLPVS